MRILKYFSTANLTKPKILENGLMLLTKIMIFMLCLLEQV